MANEGLNIIYKAFIDIVNYLKIDSDQQALNFNQIKSSLSNNPLKLEYLLSLLIALYVFKFIINFFKLIIRIATYVLFLFIIFRIVFDLFYTQEGFSNYKFEDFKNGSLNIISETLNCLKIAFYSFSKLLGIFFNRKK